jgi:hypothetical protein
MPLVCCSFVFCIQYVGKPERKRPLGRPRRRWEDNIIDLRETGCEGLDCVHLAQDRDQWWAFVNTVMNCQVAYKAVNFLTS